MNSVNLLTIVGLLTRIIGYVMYFLGMYLLIDKRKVRLATLITCAITLITLGRTIQFM